MKNILITVLLSILFSFSNLGELRATHYVGGEMSYYCIGGNQYQVTYTFYRDCAGIAAPTNINMNFHCLSNWIHSFNYILIKIPGTGQKITSACALNSGNLCGIEEYVYQGTVTLAPCGSWNINYTDCCRNNITTISNNSQNSWYNSTTLNTLIASGNNSPIFNQKPQFIIHNGQYTTIDLSASDPDGDILIYSLETPLRTSLTDTIAYILPWSKTNFLTAQYPQGITLDSNTGQISFTPTQNLTTIFGLKVKEYRMINGVLTLIGSVFRDVQLSVINESNYTPILSGMTTSPTNSYNPIDTIYKMDICNINKTINFNIYGFDQDTLNPANTGHNERFSINWDTSLTNATFTPHYNGTDSAYASFSWTPDTSNMNHLRYFTATISDEACPYIGLKNYKYYLNFIQGEIIEIGTDTSICNGDSISISPYTNYNPLNYIWSIDGNAIGNPPNQSSIIFNSTNFNLGQHLVKVKGVSNNPQSICPDSDSLMIDIRYQPHINGLFPDTTICLGNSISFDAGIGSTYAWYDYASNLVCSTRIFTPTNGGVYSVLVDGGFNMQCFDNDTFSLIIDIAPPAFNLGNDTTINPTSSLVLSIPTLGSPNYNWNTGATTQSITIDNSYNWINKIIGMADYGNQCVTSDTIYVYIGSVGMEGNSDSPLKIYPNPVQSFINIELQKSYAESTIEILDINGKQISKAHFEGKFYKLNSLETLTKGVYILHLQNEELNVLMRFVKE